MKKENKKSIKDILITIIIPIYNVEKYLNKCIESVLENEEKAIEIILLNDGSVDNSEKICLKYKKLDKRIKYIKKKNEGCSKTRNLGINLARGKYIWFIDGDDKINSTAISELIKIVNIEDNDIFIFGAIKINKNGKILSKNTPYKKIESIDSIFLVNCWNKLYKKEFLKKEKIIFPENCHMGEDLAFNLKIISCTNNIKIIEKNYYYYMISGEGVTSNLEKRIEIFTAFDDIFKFYRKKNNFNKNKEKLKEIYKKHAIYYTYNTLLVNKNSKNHLKKIDIELKKRKQIFNSEFIFYRKYIFYKITIKRSLKNVLKTLIKWLIK